MRRGKVFFQDRLAGWIEAYDEGYRFRYSPDYLATADAQPISVTLPLRAEPFTSRAMLPFFDGLILEGWLLDIASKHWKIDRRNRMDLLLTVCGNCVGAVWIEAESPNPKSANEDAST